MRVIGRRSCWRFGRALYMEARADVLNQMQTNGEQSLQIQFLKLVAGDREKFTVFDVGANVGDWSLFLLERSCGLRISDRMNIHLFEPVPETFQLLQAALSQYRDRVNVRDEPVALSDSEGLAQMFVYGETSGVNSLHPIGSRSDQKCIRVEKTTLDVYCRCYGIDEIHFLKCDTEGHDMSVIEGAKNMFEQGRIKACQFEYNHRWIFSRHYLKDVFDYFRGTPYYIGKITPYGVELFEKWHAEMERFFEGNYLVVHHDALNWFLVREGEFDIFNTYVSRYKKEFLGWPF